MKQSWLIVVLMFAQSAAHGWNVFGQDDRVPMTSTRFPWSAIGYVSSAGCTGTLVARNLVLTAAHCVISDGKLRSDIQYFYASAAYGLALQKSWIEYVWWGTTQPDDERENDWAILKIREPLGDRLGWIGTTTALSSYVTLAGYSEDFQNGNTAGVHVGCQIREREREFLLHDCDLARGASGGPLLAEQNGKLVIVALSVAEYRGNSHSSLYVPTYSDERANIAIPVSRFIGTLQKILAGN